jgi:hypothetical protein
MSLLGLPTAPGAGGTYLYAQVALPPKGPASLVRTTVVTTSAQPATSHPAGGDLVTVALLTDGKETGRADVLVPPLACASQGEPRLVSAFLPVPGLPADDGSVHELVISSDGAEVLRQKLATRAPQLHLVGAPSAGSTATGRVELSWTAVAAAEEETHVALWLLPDDQSAVPLTFAGLGDTVSIDLDTLPPSAKAVLRLVATSGIGTTSVDSDPFVIPERPPVVQVRTSVGDGAVRPGQPFAVEALVRDGLGQPVADPRAVSWTSDVEGDLGIGLQRDLVLWTSGVHRLTARWKSEDGVAEASAAVAVQRSAVRLMHVADPSTTTGSCTVLADKRLDGRGDLVLAVTSVWNPGGKGGTYWASPLGVAFDGKRWQVRSLDGSPVPQGAALLVDALEPGPTSYRAVRDATKGAVHPVLPDWADQAATVLLVTPTWAAGTSVAATPGVVCVDASRPGAGAFQHVVTADTVSSNWSRIVHPDLQGHPEAPPQVSCTATGGSPSVGPIGVWYDGSTWCVFRQDRQPMPVGATFSVVL